MNSRLDDDYVPTSRLDEGYDELNAVKKAEALVPQPTARKKRISQGASSTRFNTERPINRSRLDDGDDSLIGSRLDRDRPRIGLGALKR